MDNIDLEIDNYDLHDLLHLFKMPYPFDVDDLRRAKKIVLHTHPDKSGLPKEYFLFFVKAFKLLHGLYGNRSKNIEYILDEPSEEAILLKPLIDSNDFNKKFNELFEQYRIKQADDNGYGDWLQSSEDLNESVVTTSSAMNNHIEQRQRALCVRETVKGIGEEVASNIDPDPPANYTSNLFSKLRYDDVRKAHTETVIPISESDRPIFTNEEQLRNYRAHTTVKPLNESAAANVLKENRQNEERADIQRAYRLAKQDEEVTLVNAKWKKEFLMLAEK